jgi:hypothetical protein
MRVIEGLYDGVTTSELDNLAAETAASMTISHPDYAQLAARIAISNLHKNTNKSFSETMKEMYFYVNPRTNQKAPLLSDEVHEAIQANAEFLNSHIIYNRDFNYDYFGFKTLERSYLLKINGKIVERPQHMLMRVAVGIHLNDMESVIETYDLMSKKFSNEIDMGFVIAAVEKMRGQILYICPEDFQKTKDLFDILKVPYFNAPLEAETTCSDLCIQGLVDAVLSEDTDVLAFGGSNIIFDNKLYNLGVILEQLELNQDEFIDYVEATKKYRNEKKKPILIIYPVVKDELIFPLYYFILPIINGGKKVQYIVRKKRK